MKSVLFAIVLATLLARSAPAATPFRPFILNLAPGSSPAAVLAVLGLPSAMLRRDLWIYQNFAHPNPNAANPEFDTLVVAFTDGRVTAVKITDGRIIRQLLAQQESQTARTAKAEK
jgi:hypothetical protein